MFTAALRDLWWRRRRFAIAILAAGLVFAMSLVMSGLAASFSREVDRVVGALDATTYYAAEGATGPFYSGALLPAAAAPKGASGVLFSVVSVNGPHGVVQVLVFGVEPGGVGSPVASKGQPLGGPGEAVASTRFGVDVGGSVTVGSASFRVVGTAKKLTLLGGQPAIFLSLSDAQQLFAGGQPLAKFFLSRGSDPAPAGLTAFTRAQTRTDLMRPIKSASSSITFVTVLLWVVAACIIGSVVLLSAMERTRDFAVFKATGASTRSIGAGLLFQALVLAFVASLIAMVIGYLLAPRFPMTIEIPASAVVTLPVVALVIGAIASLAGLRRSTAISPAAAFGGAT